MDELTSQDPRSLIRQWMEQEQGGESFPVPFDNVWAMAGYSRKSVALRHFPKLEEGIDFSLILMPPDGPGRPRKIYRLSIVGFVKFLSESNTAQCKEFVFAIIAALLGQQSQPDGFHAKSNDLTGFVYLIRQTITPYYKIGKSKDPYKRLQTLQTGTPLELQIVSRVWSFDAVRLESTLHEYFDAYRVRGEWFDLPSELVGRFVAIATELDSENEMALEEATHG